MVHLGSQLGGQSRGFLLSLARWVVSSTLIMLTRIFRLLLQIGVRCKTKRGNGSESFSAHDVRKGHHLRGTTLPEARRGDLLSKAFGGALPGLYWISRGIFPVVTLRWRPWRTVGSAFSCLFQIRSIFFKTKEDLSRTTLFLCIAFFFSISLSLSESLSLSLSLPLSLSLCKF